jgi:hypothetical protein
LFLQILLTLPQSKQYAVINKSTKDFFIPLLRFVSMPRGI